MLDPGALLVARAITRAARAARLDLGVVAHGAELGVESVESALQGVEQAHLHEHAVARAGRVSHAQRQVAPQIFEARALELRRAPHTRELVARPFRAGIGGRDRTPRVGGRRRDGREAAGRGGASASAGASSVPRDRRSAEAVAS